MKNHELEIRVVTCSERNCRKQVRTADVLSQNFLCSGV